MPSLIECKTYRWRGHHEGDPNRSRYRTMEEVAEWKEKCPIKQFAKVLIEKKAATQKRLSALEKEIAEEIEATVAFADRSAFPTLQDMYETSTFERIEHNERDYLLPGHQ